jgi:septal ring factor EnvC (AmiA/AmiB activator)
MSNQAAMARRQRERARKQQAQEKLAKREERREQKKTGPKVDDDPMNDPTIDWGDAVREQPILEETTPDESQS